MQCVGISNPLTLQTEQMKVKQSQCVGIESPWTLTKVKKMSQCVGMRNPQTLTSDKQLVQCVGEIVLWTLQYKKKNKMETNNNRIMNNLKNKCKLEDYIQESMYPPQSNSINTDQQNTYHQIRLKDPARVVSTSPIGITVPNIEIKSDSTQQQSTDNLYQTGQQSASSILQDSHQLQIQSLQTTSYQTTIDSQLSRECPPIEISPNHIKYLLENHQTQTKWPIGGILIHFLDIWKLIKAETLITRGIKAYWIKKQSPVSLQSNITIPIQNRSKESQQALGLLIQKELQEETVEEVSLNY
ncbi:MAG: hypothetical protein EZS28_009380 [Streblomastix strix]|uniref:Uncharacterized protein n=1 Tax=Streblomastix strix TaxID=222440 RepID=A0A5J4WKF5_9EUKA|nr:MAG: hypothetical protein EZS28_009380 [Streblomastix strix]